MRAALDTKRYREYIQRSQEGFDASLQVFASHLWHDAEGHVSGRAAPVLAVCLLRRGAVPPSPSLLPAAPPLVSSPSRSLSPVNLLPHTPPDCQATGLLTRLSALVLLLSISLSCFPSSLLSVDHTTIPRLNPPACSISRA